MECDKGFPVANWPDKVGLYKVVQLQIGEHLHLFLGPHTSYHRDILANALQTHEITYEKARCRGSVRDIPFPKTLYPVPSGKGVLETNPEKRIATFYDESIDYGLGVDFDNLQVIKSLYPEWTFQTMNQYHNRVGI